MQEHWNFFFSSKIFLPTPNTHLATQLKYPTQDTPSGRICNYFRRWKEAGEEAMDRHATVGLLTNCRPNGMQQPLEGIGKCTGKVRYQCVPLTPRGAAGLLRCSGSSLISVDGFNYDTCGWPAVTKRPRSFWPRSQLGGRFPFSSSVSPRRPGCSIKSLVLSRVSLKRRHASRDPRTAGPTGPTATQT